ncbi:MAG: 16S rRNA (adenine(1518)-N(6)/adenine(1519)-N(6))-dimethyltransferase RsmA [Firmicutes bacterium]|nr:16S rRNA (adenine(1518)-N(6)/adenine(1519)-N(6))-dimethyltransferase RsmA [Bacillota bacterium]
MEQYVDPRSMTGISHTIAAFGLSPKHDLGQNFLIDRQALDRIAEVTAQVGVSSVLEIGAGPGGLTLSLLEKGLYVVAIELDGRAVKLLQALAQDSGDHLIVKQGDALRLSWDGVMHEAGHHAPWAIVGNLPYYITAPLLARLWEQSAAWQSAIFMVQKEVADRLLAGPGQRNSSALSVMLHAVADVSHVLSVPRTSFFPVPAVDSSVVQLKRKAPMFIALTDLRWVVQAGFKQRRKMIRKALAAEAQSPWPINEWSHKLEASGIDPTKRAEALTLNEWITLATIFSTK